jgi:hypothetical protein
MDMTAKVGIADKLDAQLKDGIPCKSVDISQNYLKFVKNMGFLDS